MKPIELLLYAAKHLLDAGGSRDAHEEYARLERRAKDWAKGAQGGDSYHGEPCTYCDSCNRSVDGRYGKCDVFRPHAHDCDAAIILDLERESGG